MVTVVRLILILLFEHLFYKMSYLIGKSSLVQDPR